MKIALIEDEVLLNETIKTLLELEGFDVDSYESAKEFLKNSQNKRYDVIIADIALPDANFLQEIEKHKKLLDDSKVIIISAFSSLEYIKKAFELGADDFLKKPFESEELILRIKKLFKIKKTKLSDDVYYDPEAKSIITKDGMEPLTKKEAALLELLIKNRGKYISFDTLTYAVWGESVSSNTIAALVKRLRQKIKDKSLITSKREIGYMLKEKVYA